MNCDISELLDIQKLEAVLGSLFRLNGSECAVADAAGRIVARSGATGLCATCRQLHPETVCLCEGRSLPHAGAKPAVSICPKGLAEAAGPVIIGGEPVGWVSVGPVFLEPPDEGSLPESAASLGPEQGDGLAALRRVPICTEEELLNELELLVSLAGSMAEQGFSLKREREKHARHHAESQRLWAVVERAKRDWEQTFDAVPDLITIIDQNHFIKRVNRATAELLGLHPRDLVGRKCYEVLHGTDVLPPGCPASRAMESGTTQHGEFERSKRSYRVTVSPISDASGCVTSCVHVAHDVTESKEKENALTASERFLRAITDNIPGMVGYWDKELRCGFANEAYLQWFGRSSEQILGMNIRELLGEELFKKNEPFVLRALAGEMQHFERTLTKADGSVGHTWAQYIPDVVDGATRGFFVLVTDVTELKLAEEAKAELEGRLQQAQKMESVGRLAGGVAHDFNNQLTVIMAYADMGLTEIDEADPLHPMLQQIARAAERSAGLTHQLLAFARRQPVTPEVLDLNDTVRDMLKMLRRLIGEHIHLTWRAAGEPCRVKMDPTQADQIIANLCINARDAIADYGEIRIETGTRTVGAVRSDRDILPGNYVYLAVRDNGCGMDQETLKQIFEPFFTTKELGKGTGLGLSTVYGITRQNGGFIEVESSAGRGTSFTIHLPQCREEAKAPHAAAPRHDSGGAETILLVEDEPSILGMARDLLERKGYRVLAARSPAEALSAAEREGGVIHLLLTDVIMGQMNGRDLSRELAARRPGLKCLYMSGYTADLIGHHGVMGDDVRFIAKPFKATELARQVREALDA